MNLFLKATAIFEGLTGLSLIIAPNLLLQILFLSTFEESSAIFVARIAGIALFTIALLCWGIKDSVIFVLNLLLFYNIAVLIIAAYSLFYFKLKGMGIEVIISFHILFAAWGILVLKKHRKN